MDPLPIQYPSAPAPVPFPYVLGSLDTSSQPQAVFNQAVAPPAQPLVESDYILDEAVDELFLNEAGLDSYMSDFVSDWEPALDTADSDAQLGFLLDKILAED